ncbi:hypothetical protein [Pandoraea communis]|uniref:hypothetical protein n=1 Tax=Pandoraea communis TaxID=2508297 RepID=UPI0025A522B9|nr:hypothetical protein [Pandoraea communis]MDM8358259.1 hypothetical protein [Pandoraea communis]
MTSGIGKLHFCEISHFSSKNRPNSDVFRRDPRENPGVTAWTVNSVDRQGPKGGKYRHLAVYVNGTDDLSHLCRDIEET